MDEVRDKLIELLQDCDCPYPCKAAGHLIANGVTVQRWIPVSEKLPKPGERVLATDGVVVGEMYFAITKHWHRYNGISWKNFADTQITHWQPLPDAPKEVE